MKRITALLIALVFVLSLTLGCTSNPNASATNTGATSADTKTATSEPTDNAVTIYVAANGDDKADGTKGAPLATISAAVDKAVSQPDGSEVIISVENGRYFISETIVVPSNNLSSLTVLGNGAVLTGGIRISIADLSNVDDEITARVPETARDSVLSVDLTKYGYNTEKYASMYPADKAVYLDNKRLTIARYPDTTLMPLSDATITSEGDKTSCEIKFRSALKKELAKWTSIDDLYIYGYPYYTWYSIYEKVSNIDVDACTVTISETTDGARKGGTLAFINIPEILDYADEFYISPDGRLYLYASDELDGEYIYIPNTDVAFFDLQNVSNTRITSFVMSDTQGLAITGSGNNITIDSCEIARMTSAIRLNGNNNTISDCNIHNISKDVIYVSGGETFSLTPSNTVVTNNIIKDFAESDLCYRNAITVQGVGHTVSHNEISGSIHMAVTFWGNNNILEYNDIHDVCLTSSDCGAVYLGRSNLSGGNIYRYNFIHDVGRGSLVSNGIYFDDCLSGQIAYGNVIVRCTGNGFLIGGGRSHTVEGNLIVSCKNSSIEYDARGYDGQFGNGSWKQIVDFSFETFKDERYINDTWKEAFPWLFAATITENPDPDDGNWLCAPGGSSLKKNVFIITDLYGDIASYDSLSDDEKQHFKERINETVYRFSDVDPLEIIEAQLDTYTLEEISKLDLPDYLFIPFEEIGLIK